MGKEQLIPALIFLFVGILLIFLGLLVHKYKQHDLISGYNTMPEEKKSRFDIDKYARVFGIVFYMMGSLIVLGIPMFYALRLELSYYALYFFVIVVGGVSYLNVVGWTFRRKS